jgi:hypothetical protein
MPLRNAAVWPTKGQPRLGQAPWDLGPETYRKVAWGTTMCLWNSMRLRQEWLAGRRTHPGQRQLIGILHAQRRISSATNVSVKEAGSL